MATITPTVERSNDGNLVKFTYTNMANGDVGVPIKWPDYADRSVQVKGTFGVGGNLRFEGSNDGGTTYRSLADAGIGALSTRYEDTPFTIKENGEVIGQVRGSSVWLGEESGAGIVRQIDIAVVVMAHGDHLVAGHGSAGRVGAMG